MKRIATAVVALGLIAVACGGDDDGDATADLASDTSVTTEAPAESADEAAAEPSGEAVEETEATPTTTATTAPVATTAEPTDDADSDTGDTDSTSISSIDDIPEACREQLASFLQAIEPVVSTVDWETATFADFEAIAEDLDAVSEDFDLEDGSDQCEDLEFIDAAENPIIAEFAREVAPGSVGFIEFLDDVQTIATGDDGSGDESAGFADCAEAIAYIQELIDTYDALTDAPATEFAKLASLATVATTCTPEQLEFFNSPEVNEFLAD